MSVTFTASAGGRVVTKAYDLDLRNFRHFVLNMEVDGGSVGAPFIFTMGGKAYTVSASATAATDYDIDTMAPDALLGSGVLASDTTDSAWAPQGQITGLEQIGSITITMPHSTTVMILHSFTAVRHASTVPGWTAQEQMPGDQYLEAYHSDAAPGLDTWTFLRAKLMGAICDGKPIADLYYALRKSTTPLVYVFANGITTGGGSPNLERLSMTNWAAEVNSSRQLGLSATTIAEYPSPIPDGAGGFRNYYGGRLYASYLTRDAIGAPASYGEDYSSIALNAWPAYGQVKIYPGFAGGYHLRFVKRVWGVPYGTVVASSPAGIAVRARSSLGADETVTTDANGFFKFAPRPTSHIFQNVAVMSISATRRVLDAMYRWFGFYALVRTDGNPSNAHHPQWGYYLRVWIHNGNVLFSRSNSGTPTHVFDVASVSVTTSGQDSDPHVVYDRAGAQQLFCFFCRTAGGTSNAMLSISWDDGLTWGTPVIVIPSGKHPVAPLSRDGTLIVAGYLGPNGGPGVITAKAQAMGHLSLGSAFNLKDSTGTDLAVNDDTFGISPDPSGANRWLLAVVISGDTGISEWFSTDWDARTWTRVV